MRRHLSVLGNIMLVVACFYGESFPVQPSKKLIEFGCDMPAIDFVYKNIVEMEKQPFDGIVFFIPKTRLIFMKKEFEMSGSNRSLVLNMCQKIGWNRFTDNFLLVWSSRDTAWSWFNDADWGATLHNLDFIAEAASFARCKGICFDPEPYGPSPWAYVQMEPERSRSFAEYEKIVRKRGNEFITTIQKRLSNPVILCLFQLSVLDNVSLEQSREKRQSLLSNHAYALLPAFLEGMLDCIGPQSTIVDGDEAAYYLTETSQYASIRQKIHSYTGTLISPENTEKYKTHVQAGHSLYVDYVFGQGAWRVRKDPAHLLSTKEQAQWFEQNTYTALQASDQYVWLYSETMDWWKNEGVPAGLREAVVSARTKIAVGQPLGFDIEWILRVAVLKTRFLPLFDTNKK